MDRRVPRGVNTRAVLQNRSNRHYDIDFDDFYTQYPDPSVENFVAMVSYHILMGLFVNNPRDLPWQDGVRQMWVPRSMYHGPPPTYVLRFLGRRPPTEQQIERIPWQLFSDILASETGGAQFYTNEWRELPRLYWPTITYPITENTTWYFYYILMCNYFDSRQPPMFYTNPQHPYPFTLGYVHSNQTWRHRNRIDFLLFHSRWVHQLSFTTEWSQLLRQRRCRTRCRRIPISAPDMFEYVDSDPSILSYNLYIGSRRDQYYVILNHLIPYYEPCLTGTPEDREAARVIYVEQQQYLLSFYAEPELSHMRRVFRTIHRWRLADRRHWSNTNVLNRNSTHNAQYTNAPWSSPTAQVNLLRLHDRAYSSTNPPHPRSVFLDTNRMLQGGLWYGTPMDIDSHYTYSLRDWYPGLYLPHRTAFQRYGRPFYNTRFFTVNEYFGAFDPTNNASHLDYEFDPEDDIEEADDTGPPRY
jgi:hypothetical protein